MNFLIIGNNQEQRDFNFELEKHVARKVQIYNWF